MIELSVNDLELLQTPHLRFSWKSSWSQSNKVHSDNKGTAYCSSTNFEKKTNFYERDWGLDVLLHYKLNGFV